MPNIEDNKLIAEFMGEEPIPFDELCKQYNVPEEEIPNMPTWEAMLNYHVSWDKLIPVLQKIEKVKLKEGNNVFNHAVESFGLYGGVMLVETNIERVHKSVVEFIKWYNEESNK